MRRNNSGLGGFVVMILVAAIAFGAVTFQTFNGNRTLIDTKFYYDYAIVQLADGSVIEGKVDTWRDYEGEQIQVTINGETWLVHSANISMRAH